MKMEDEANVFFEAVLKPICEEIGRRPVARDPDPWRYPPPPGTVTPSIAEKMLLDAIDRAQRDLSPLAASYLRAKVQLWAEQLRELLGG